MKGINWVKLGISLIPFGVVSPLLFIPLDYLWNFMTVGIAIFTIFAIEVLGFFFIFYGKRKAKYEFSRRIQEIIQDKRKITPPELEQIEQEVFGSIKLFGIYWHPYSDDLLKQLWRLKRLNEVLEPQDSEVKAI